MEPALLATVAAVLLAFGLVSRRAERSFVTPPMVFTTLGLALGGAGLGWIEAGETNRALHVLAELTLALVLFTDAARIDLGCLRREGAIPARLLLVGLPLCIALGALAALALFPELGLWGALLLAAILAPTDAALGQAVVSSALVPLRIRQSLNVESGLNDGLALPAVLVLASLAGAGAGGDASQWLGFVALQLVLGPAVGLAVGALGGRGLEIGSRAGWTAPAFQRLSALALALLAFAGAEWLGGNGFIAAFVAGASLGRAAPTSCTRLHDFGEAEGQLLTLLVFLVFGASLLPAALAHVDSRTLGYALLSLGPVRMGAVALGLAGRGLRPASVAFLGWFGPRGLASVLFVLVVVEGGALAQAPHIESAVMLTVALSVLLHGASAYPLALRYGSRCEALRGAGLLEHESVSELPVRVRHAGPQPPPGGTT